MDLIRRLREEKAQKRHVAEGGGRLKDDEILEESDIVVDDALFFGDGLFDESKHSLSVPVGLVFCMNEFVSSEAEKELIRCIDSYKSRWVALKRRRLLVFGGNVQPGGGVDAAEELPVWLKPLVDLLVRSGVFPHEKRPNHALINEYLPGQGIHPHTDGTAYWPRVCTLSLSSASVMTFTPRLAPSEIGTNLERHRNETESSEVYLPRRSLAIFWGDAYHNMLHSIPEREEDPITSSTVNAPPTLKTNIRSRRISITLRHVQ